MSATTPPPEHLDVLVEDLAARFIQARREAEEWDALKKDLGAQLKDLHARGWIPTQFEAAGHRFSLQPGKSSSSPDDYAAAQLAALRADLQEEGHFTTTTGDPFWVPRKIKAPKAGTAGTGAA